MSVQLRTEVAPQPVARIRRRALNVQPEVLHPVAPAPTVDEAQLGPSPEVAQMQVHLRDYVIANTLKNAADRQAVAAKKALHGAMARAGVKAFPGIDVEMDGVKVRADAVIEAQESEKIDVAKLRTLVDEATFMKIISATKTAVDTHAGRNITVASTVSVADAEDLRIRVAKP